MVLENQDIKIQLADAKQVVNEIHKVTANGGPFEITTKVREGIEYKAYATLPMNLAAMYKSAADIHDQEEFLIFTNERYSFRSIYQQASAFAHVLVNDYKINAGDKVVIAMRNYPEWIAAFMAITSTGAVAVPLNAWWQEEEFSHVIEHCHASLVICDDKRFDLLNSWLTTKQLPTIVARPSASQKQAHNFADLVNKYQGKAMPEIDIDADNVATIFYTSGSTGFPKGAVSTHESILTAINTWLMLGTAAGIANNSLGDTPEFKACALMTVPLFHVTGCHTLFLLSMIAGRKTVMMPYWDPTLALELIEKEQVTYFNGVPTMSLELMNHPEKDNYNLTSLNDVCAGGAARPPEHVRKIYEAFSQGNPSCGYGLTETNALGAVNGPADYIQKPLSAGLPTPPVVDVLIYNDQKQIMPTGIVGEIAIKSISNIIAYWRNSKATQEAFCDGYFLTGDLGYLDEDGFLFIVDRAKDIIIRGGENIACLDVESALYKHPEVIESAVFAVPNERLGEVVGAVIYVNQQSSLNAEQMKAFVGTHIAKFKVPEHLWIVQKSLPRLGSGKIDKQQLRHTYI